MSTPEEIIARVQAVEGSSVERIVAEGSHTNAKDFLGQVSVAVETYGKPLRAVYNGYELEVDGTVAPDDLDHAYQSTVAAHKRCSRLPEDPLSQLPRAA